MILLKLFIAGNSVQSRRAQTNVQMLIDEHKDTDIQLALIDLLKTPQDAVTYNILAIPTLLREEPQPAEQLVGDLSDAERVWEVLAN